MARLLVGAGPLRDCYVDTLVLEAKLGRKLLPGMTVGYVDGNSLNVAPHNLLEVSKRENAIHAPFSEEDRWREGFLTAVL